MLLSAIIVDDEEYGRTNLCMLIEKYCKHIKVVGLANSISQANKLLELEKPEVIFLDIIMPRNDGFELLKSLGLNNYYPYVVFVTANEHYALKAIKNNAFDYILKPVDVPELMNCEQKLIHAASLKLNKGINKNIQAESANFENDKLCINYAKGIALIDIKDILYFEAIGNYTIINYYKLDKTEKLTVSKTLRDFEKTLTDKNFFRIHKSYMINVDAMKAFINENSGYVIMANNASMEVSRRKSSLFREYIQANYNNANPANE